MKEWRPSQSQQTQLAPPSNLQEVQNAHTQLDFKAKLSCDPSSVCGQEIYSSEEKEAPAWARVVPLWWELKDSMLFLFSHK